MRRPATWLRPRTAFSPPVLITLSNSLPCPKCASGLPGTTCRCGQAKAQKAPACLTAGEASKPALGAAGRGWGAEALQYTRSSGRAAGPRKPPSRRLQDRGWPAGAGPTGALGATSAGLYNLDCFTVESVRYLLESGLLRGNTEQRLDPAVRGTEAAGPCRAVCRNYLALAPGQRRQKTSAENALKYPKICTAGPRHHGHVAHSGGGGRGQNAAGRAGQPAGAGGRGREARMRYMLLP